MSSTSFFVYEVGYFTQAPTEYTCQYVEGYVPPENKDDTICTQENICDGNPNIKSWEADPNSDDTLYNWQQRLDLTCKNDILIGLIGASIFLGMSVTLLWLPSFADRGGRKKYFMLS